MGHVHPRLLLPPAAHECQSVGVSTGGISSPREWGDVMASRESAAGGRALRGSALPGSEQGLRGQLGGTTFSLLPGGGVAPTMEASDGAPGRASDAASEVDVRDPVVQIDLREKAVAESREWASLGSLGQGSAAAQRPLLLVDIDGVLNIFDGWRQASWTDGRGRARRGLVAPDHLRESEAAGYRLLLNPEHPEMFAMLERVFEVHWATMWTDRAWMFGEAAGFGRDWPFIEFDDFRISSTLRRFRIGAGVGDYKHPGIVAALGDRPGIWVDDDMSDRQLEWARERDVAGIPTLFIRPDPARGFTREDFERVLSFASDGSGDCATIAG